MSKMKNPEKSEVLDYFLCFQVVREVSCYTQNFRVLALSATPGDGIKVMCIYSGYNNTYFQLRDPATISKTFLVKNDPLP